MQIHNSRVESFESAQNLESRGRQISYPLRDCVVEFGNFQIPPFFPQLKDYSYLLSLPSEVLSFILDTESLIGTMGNENISFNSQTLVSGLAALEPGNVRVITPSLNHYTTTSLTARMSFLINVNNFFLAKSADVNVY